MSWDFGSRAAFTKWCTVGFGAWTDRLPAGAGGGFVVDVVDAYEQITTAPGVLRFTKRRAELAASRS